MKDKELLEDLSEISEIKSHDTGKGIRVYFPAIDKGILLTGESIVKHHLFTDPFGNRAMRLLVNKEKPYQLIISQHDIVLEPDTGDVGLELPGMITVKISRIPPLVGYSEIVANMDRFAEICDTMNRIDHQLGQMIMFRYFINGALRLGIDCAELEYKWQKLYDRILLGKIAEQFSDTPDKEEENI